MSQPLPAVQRHNTLRRRWAVIIIIIIIIVIIIIITNKCKIGGIQFLSFWHSSNKLTFYPNDERFSLSTRLQGVET